MQKAHDASKNDFWHNRPDTSSPITETELNRIETSIDTIDNRVVTFDTTKANQSDILQAVKNISYTASTGTFRITFFNDNFVDINTDIEKVAVNFDFDDDPQSPHYQEIVIELDDGTYKYVDLSAFITQFEFLSTTTIQAVVSQDGKVSFNIINGSITEDKLQPNFLADCRAAKNAAETAEASAIESREDSEAWATGKRNGIDVPNTDETYHNNAKYYSDNARAITGNKVDTWNGRDGMVVPEDDDYEIGQINPGNNPVEGQIPIVNSSGRLEMGDIVHGHTILYSASGNPSEIAQRGKLQFEGNGVFVSDNLSANKTIVSIGDLNHFTVSANSWVPNEDSDASDFPYISEISTNAYTQDFVPSEVYILGSITNDYPTEIETEEINKIDQYIKFTGTSIRLRTAVMEPPNVALTLRVRR